MTPSPIIWILWGMWPYASVRCYKLFLEESRYFSLGRSNHHFPHLIIDNIPVQELTNDLSSLDTTIVQVRGEYLRLRESGVTIVLMACNTMHLYLDRIYDTDESVMNISLVDTMSNYLIEQGQDHVGILWSINTIRSELYHKVLRNKNITPISLEDHTILKWINMIIGKVISGEKLNMDDTHIMQTAIDNLIDQWAKCIILGCTELPIAFDGFDSPVPLYDPLLISVHEVCRQYYSPIRDSLYS